MQKADHSGHRARMKKKLREQGLDVFEPHEVLEILLYSLTKICWMMKESRSGFLLYRI